MGNQALSDFKFYLDYARYREEDKRPETWQESVKRIIDMHRVKYKEKLTPELEKLITFSEEQYNNKLVLGSQRLLQFGGEPVLKHNSKLYNCIGGYCDRVKFFQETLYWLLSGCGVGFSVQWHHIAKLPSLVRRSKGAKTFVIKDSIEGWADAFGVLLSSYVSKGATFKDYQGFRVDFDFSKIREKNSFISGGFKAPGPDGLRQSLQRAQDLIDKHLESGSNNFTPILAYDIVMHMSDAVLSGGVRRSSTICLFSPDDKEMLNAKTGDWYYKNPQRARSNNSVVLVRSETTKEQFMGIVQSVKSFGEPGFYFTEDKDYITNPCVEIGFFPQTEEGESGWQGCNLTTINGAMCATKETFLKACKASAILGTLQAGYTDFKYVGEETKKIFEREALLGCSVTGWMNNPELLFDAELQKEGARVIKKWNKIISHLIGINQAARVTCCKPEGNASVILGSASGIHGEHSPRYFRNVQANKDSDVTKLFAEINPECVEDSVWSATNSDYVISFPIVAKEGSNYKQQLVGVKQLEYVKLTQQNWIEEGTNKELCVRSDVRHNVSNTIQVDNWNEVSEYIWENKDYFAGVSLLSITGDKDYAQAPFTQVFTAKELLNMYGDAVLLASGLVVDGLHAFNDNLWLACDTVMGKGEDISKECHSNLFKQDWSRRVKQFSDNYLDSDLLKTTYCLKDVYNLHKWLKVNREVVEVDWACLEMEPQYLDVDTLGAIACSGGQCELPV